MCCLMQASLCPDMDTPPAISVSVHTDIQQRMLIRPTARGQTTPTFFDIDSVGGSSFTDLQHPQNTHIEAVKITFRLGSYVANSGTKEFRINKMCPTLLCLVPWATICLCLFSFLSSILILLYSDKYLSYSTRRFLTSEFRLYFSSTADPGGLQTYRPSDLRYYQIYATIIIPIIMMQ